MYIAVTNRIADALERIADALEDRRAPAEPKTPALPTWLCPECGASEPVRAPQAGLLAAGKLLCGECKARGVTAFVRTWDDAEGWQ